MRLLKSLGLALLFMVFIALLLTILAVGVAIIEWLFRQYAALALAFLVVLGLLTFIFYRMQGED